MHVNRKLMFWGISFALVLVVALCVAVLLSRQTAIRNAVEGCNPAYGLQPMQAPTEIRARLTTFERAVQHSDTWTSPYATRPVWIIEMKGKWLLVGGPPPPLNSKPEPAYLDRCTLIIDALTGQVRSPAIQ